MDPHRGALLRRIARVGVGAGSAGYGGPGDLAADGGRAAQGNVGSAETRGQAHADPHGGLLAGAGGIEGRGGVASRYSAWVKRVTVWEGVEGAVAGGPHRGQHGPAGRCLGPPLEDERLA